MVAVVVVLLQRSREAWWKLAERGSREVRPKVGPSVLWPTRACASLVHQVGRSARSAQASTLPALCQALGVTLRLLEFSRVTRR